MAFSAYKAQFDSRVGSLIERALYKRPLILFLAEATSHLDIEKEEQVNCAVKALEITRVIIAHRPQTIASAGRVIVLIGGKIVQDVRVPEAASPTAPGPAESLEQIA